MVRNCTNSGKKVISCLWLFVLLLVTFTTSKFFIKQQLKRNVKAQRLTAN